MTILAQLNDCHCCNDARSLVQKKEGGSLDFRKRVHMIEPKYEPIPIGAENKHATLLIDRCSEIAGKMPRTAFTPTSGFRPSSSDPKLLLATLAAEYRSLVAQQCVLHSNDMICNMQRKLVQVVFKTPKRQHDICQDLLQALRRPKNQSV